MAPAVVLYSSSMLSNGLAKVAVEKFEQLFLVKKVNAEVVDLSLEENASRKAETFAASGIRQLPQLHVDGKFIGLWEAVEDLIDAEEIDSILLG
mmetsp:Transcript_25487/g.83913  ORF Transcript_25487/g.83913 Transcript_25487/m.83913 type:complete len:94 (-) Transcript_25487:1893-2174(-)